MTLKKEDIIKAIEEMKIAELNDLIKAIEKHFDVSASAVMTTSGIQEEATESNEVNVILTEIGQSKVMAIKLVGKLTGKGLMDSKKLIEKLPATIKEKVPTDEGEDIQKQFSEIGAVVKLK